MFSSPYESEIEQLVGLLTLLLKRKLLIIMIYPSKAKSITAPTFTSTLIDVSLALCILEEDPKAMTQLLQLRQTGQMLRKLNDRTGTNSCKI
jgi:hypothetical protein